MLNLDTHIVVALLSGDLTAGERDLIEAAGQLFVSDIVNWELAKLVQLGRLELDMESREFRRFSSAVVTIPISVEIAVASTRLDFDSDPADEIIAATSVVEEIPLLTRDRRMQTSEQIPFP